VFRFLRYRRGVLGHLLAGAAAAPRIVALNPLSPRDLLVTFGLAGVFAILFAETGLLVGFFLPGDTLLALAGAFASPHVHEAVHLPLPALLIGCPAAAIIGAQVGYVIGVQGGQRLARPGSAFAHGIERIEPLFARFGEGWAVLLCRFIPVLRTFINPAVGVLRMPVRRFTVWNVVGGLVWTEAIVLAGYYGGEALHIERYVLPVVAVAVLASVASLAFELNRMRRRRAAAAASRPDPVGAAADSAGLASREADTIDSTGV